MRELIITITLLTNALNFELSITPDEKALGLMYRKIWDNTSGMIFYNEYPKMVSFWMKNTYLDMTIYFLDKDFNILEIRPTIPLSTNSITSKSDKVKYVMELDPELNKPVIYNYDEFKTLVMDKLDDLGLTEN